MPAGPISRLPESERQQLLDDLNYLNLAEINSFCKRHGIPYRIAIETKDGTRRKTPEDDRKGVVLERLRHFLRTGVGLKETCFPASVVCFEALPVELSGNERLCYGQYEKKNRQLMATLKELTDGNFREGAIARILLREFWSQGKAPTLREFVRAWLKAAKDHTAPNPEWAFLSDLARKSAGAEWKQMRAKKAARVLRILKQITK